MTCKYVVEDMNVNEQYTFYNISKIDTDGKEKLIENGLKKAQNKYEELLTERESHKIVLVKIYPNYKTGKIETDVIEAKV